MKKHCLESTAVCPAGEAGSQSIGEPPFSRLQDADMQGTYAALLRAARRAREIAWMTGTAVVYMRDGNLVFEYPVAPEPLSNPLTDPDHKGQSGGGRQ